jgi:hypothetical protein
MGYSRVPRPGSVERLSVSLAGHCVPTGGCAAAEAVVATLAIGEAVAVDRSPWYLSQNPVHHIHLGEILTSPGRRCDAWSTAHRQFLLRHESRPNDDLHDGASNFLHGTLLLGLSVLCRPTDESMGNTANWQLLGLTPSDGEQKHVVAGSIEESGVKVKGEG